MKVVSDVICPFAQRVVGVLELKAIDHEIERISLIDKPNWFLDISPRGKVPVLIEEGGFLFESSAICEYLDEIFDPKLHPSDPFKRAQHRAWGALAADNYLVQCPTMRSPTLAVFEERAAKLRPVFERIEAVLGEGAYFDGDRLSMVDADWFPLLHRAAIVQQFAGFDFLADLTELKKWQAALMKVPALTRSVCDEFEAAFVQFYLNDQTYLGQLMRDKAA